MINLNKKTIENITKTFGDAVYIFNKKEFIENYKELETTF